MLETAPGLFLALMIIITLILLPRLNNERPLSDEPRRPTEELHIKPPKKD